MSANVRGQPRLGWLDRFIVPAGTPIAPSRWHQHIVQRRVSRLDYLRPHRLNWDALKHPELAARQDDESLTPRRLAGVNTLFGLLGSGLFGRVMARLGALKTQALCGLLIPIIPTAWIWVTAPWQIGVLEAYAGLVWAGYNLANFALLLELTPASHRPRALALYQTVVFVSAVVGPLLGGWLADAFGFQVIFGASGAGRLLGILLFVWLAVWPALGACGDGPATPARAAAA